VECRNSHDSQSDEETTNTASADKEEEEEHKATTGDMKSSDNSTFDSFDGVGVVDVVSNSNAMYKGLDVLARGSLTTADGNIYERFSLQTRQTSQETRNCYTMFPPTLPSNAALVAHR
jgi:hypothetical protein